MKKLKIFPKMFIQIFSVLAIIIILVHSLVYFIFPKTYLETRKEKIYNIADEISGNMNGKEIEYIEQTLELYSKSSEIKAFIKEKNNKNEIQKIKDIATGGSNFANVSIKDILSEPIKMKAPKIIVVHNHPSGDSTPSKQDIVFTEQLYEISELMGIQLLDHLVIGNMNYTSIFSKMFS